MTMFPEPRRVVTGHDKDGNAIIVADSTVPVTAVSPELNFAVLYETHQFPASNDEWKDPTLERTQSLANPNGLVVRIVDFQAKTKPMMHRTESLDFGVVLQGELVCHLDNGVKTTVKAGDVCVQRGTNHGWENVTDQPARVMFVLSAAQPVQIDGKVLGDEGFNPKEMASGGTE